MYKKNRNETITPITTIHKKVINKRLPIFLLSMHSCIPLQQKKQAIYAAPAATPAANAAIFFLSLFAYKTNFTHRESECPNRI